MLFKVLVTILVCNIVFVIISIPLILRKVPRNIVYGFRTRATLSDDFIWYEANAYFGKLFFVSSIVSALMITFLCYSDVVPMQSFIKASIAVLVAPPTVAALLTLNYIRKLKKIDGE
jgi:hypothetical protein